MTGLSTPASQSSTSNSSSDVEEQQEDPDEFDWMESLNTKISNVKEGKKIKEEERKVDGENGGGGFDMFSEDNDMFSEKYNVSKCSLGCCHSRFIFLALVRGTSIEYSYIYLGYMCLIAEQSRNSKAANKWIRESSIDGQLGRC